MQPLQFTVGTKLITFTDNKPVETEIYSIKYYEEEEFYFGFDVKGNALFKFHANSVNVFYVLKTNKDERTVII